MKPSGRIAALAVLLSTQVACVPSVILDRANTCDRAVSMRNSWAAAPPSGSELVEASTGTDAEAPALDAQRMTIVTGVAGGLGAGALVAGFVTFFAVRGSNQTVADAGYGVIGGALGLGVISTALGILSSRRRTEAVRRLLFYADHCAEGRGEAP